MVSFASLKVRHNIMIAVAVAGLVAASVGGIGLVKISDVADSAKEMYTRALLPAADAADLRVAVWQYRFYGIGANTIVDPAVRTQFNQSRDQAATRIDAAAKQFASRDIDPAQRAAIDQFTATWAEYTAVLAEGQQLIAAGKAAEGRRCSPGRDRRRRRRRSSTSVPSPRCPAPPRRPGSPTPTTPATRPG